MIPSGFYWRRRLQGEKMEGIRNILSYSALQLGCETSANVSAYVVEASSFSIPTVGNVPALLHRHHVVQLPPDSLRHREHAQVSLRNASPIFYARRYVRKILAYGR